MMSQVRISFELREFWMDDAVVRQSDERLEAAPFVSCAKSGHEMMVGNEKNLELLPEVANEIQTTVAIPYEGASGRSHFPRSVLDQWRRDGESVCLLTGPQLGFFLHLLLRNPPDWDAKTHSPPCL
jgi:hypothetical protein